MKHNNEHQPVEKIGVVQEQTFKIRASATSFAILSSGLYSNKILAIIRELSCNAYDAHKASGNQDTPFDICLPSILDPNFIVKDYGIGLSHEDVMTIYTTYFESTKNDSDDYIGQLGLGSKSPFSYASTFMVESRHNGILNSYCMYINEDGVPAINHLGSAETDEHSGMTITIAVKPNDYYRFNEEAQRALMYFKPYPNVIGNPSHRQSLFTYRMQKDRWAVREENGNHASSPFVVQGFVRYPIDAGQIMQSQTEEFTLTPEAQSLLTAPIDFIVPIGLVQVAPSREHLSYDRKTIQNLITFINACSEDIIDSMQELIDACATLWDARVLCSTFMDQRSVFRKLYERMVDKKFNLNYRGTPLSNTVALDPAVIDITGMIVSVHYRTSNYRYNSRKVETTAYSQGSIANTGMLKALHGPVIHINENVKVLWNDVDVSSVKMRRYVADKLQQRHTLIELHPAIKKMCIEHKVAEFLEFLGLPDDYELIRASDLLASGDIPETPKKVATKTSNLRMPILRGHSRQYRTSTADWYRSDVDVKDGGYCINYYNGNAIISHDDKFASGVPYAGLLVRFLRDKKLIGKDDDVVGVTKANVNKFKKAGNWINIVDVFTDYVHKNIDVIAQRVAAVTLASSRPISISSENCAFICEGLDEDSFFKNYSDAINLNKNTADLDFSNFDQFYDILSEEDTKIIEETVDKFQGAYTAEILFEKYPMLTAVNACGYYASAEVLKHTRDYIKMMDRKILNEQIFQASAEDLVDVLVETA